MNNELNKNRMKWNNDWSVSYKKLREHFITRVAQKFVNNSNEMKSVVAKFFDQSIFTLIIFLFCIHTIFMQ